MSDQLFSSQSPGLAPIPPAEDDDLDIVLPQPADDGDPLIVVNTEDGTITVDLSGGQKPKDDDEFDANLALTMGDGELGTMAADLNEGVTADLQSSAQWRQTYSEGITWLGIKLQEPRGDIGSSSSPLEGMSTFVHPMMLEATLRGHASAIGEMLPASGPVKVENDGEPSTEDDALAETLQTDFNYTLKKAWPEYYPDTDQMFLKLYFGGLGYKKGYHDPLKKRPVIESIPPEDLIVSNGATDLQTAGRVTHRFPMAPYLMKQMQAMKIYRNAPLGTPTQKNDPVKAKIALTQGTQANITRTEDQPYTLYETRCRLKLNDSKVPEDWKDVPVPYRVTFDSDSQQVLEIRRDWRETDPTCQRKRRIVKYTYIPGFGFYPLGLLHIMGNLTRAVTAAAREGLDTGMFANFPGFLIAKWATRQNSNEMRTAPGTGTPIDTQGQDIRSAVMALPYKDVTAGLMAMMNGLKEDGQRVGSVADTGIGEGRQDAPVGTTLALIEQATKIESEVHKRNHQSQSEEFQMLKELLEEDPGSFWRHNPKCAGRWDEQKFLAALNRCNLVPVADPNTPSHLHRLMKAMGLIQLDKAYPGKLNTDDILKSVLRVMGAPDSLVLPPPAPGTQPPLDPKTMAMLAKIKQGDAQAALKMQEIQLEAAKMQNELRLELLKLEGAAQDRASQERQDAIKRQIELIQLAATLAIHPDSAGMAGNVARGQLQ
jgi:hypothetical protein